MTCAVLTCTKSCPIGTLGPLPRTEASGTERLAATRVEATEQSEYG